MAVGQQYGRGAGIPQGARGVLVDQPCQFVTVSAGAGNVNAIVSGLLWLHIVIISPAATGTLKLFDGLTVAGALIFDGTTAPFVASNPFPLQFDIICATGLSATLGVTGFNFTVCFRQQV